MAEHLTWRGRIAVFVDRRHAKRAGRASVTTHFTRAPEPRHMGLADNGQHLVADAFLFSGLRINAPELAIWDLAPQDLDVIAEIHGCDWLADLAALGDEAARTKAQAWVHDWIAPFASTCVLQATPSARAI